MNVPNINNLIQSNNFKNDLQKIEDNDFKNKLESAMNSKDKEQLKKVSQELEAIFLNMMFSQMKSTIIKSDLVKEAPGHEIWQSMFNEKIAEESSKGKSIGLADMIYKQISTNIDNAYKIKE